MKFVVRERVKLNVIILLRIMQKESIRARLIKKSSRVIKNKWKLIDVEDFSSNQELILSWVR